MAWYDEAVFYHIYPLGLTGAPAQNPYGEPVHRLERLTPWIRHIRDIGCTGLYIGPLFESVGHGYETTDYRRVDSRLGTNEEYTTILDMKVPVLTIPVKPGRNLAVIVEVAAMNNRQKRMGFNAAKEFARQLDEHFEEMMMQSQMETAEDYDEYDDLSYEED